MFTIRYKAHHDTVVYGILQSQFVCNRGINFIKKRIWILIRIRIPALNCMYCMYISSLVPEICTHLRISSESLWAVGRTSVRITKHYLTNLPRIMGDLLGSESAWTMRIRIQKIKKHRKWAKKEQKTWRIFIFFIFFSFCECRCDPGSRSALQLMRFTAL